jgi:hypothetical protein
MTIGKYYNHTLNVNTFSFIPQKEEIIKLIIEICGKI